MKILAMGVLIVLLAVLLAGCKETPETAADGETGSATVEESLWLTDLDEAFARAKEQGRPVIADFYADSCGACQVLDDETLSDPAVEEILAET